MAQHYVCPDCGGMSDHEQDCGTVGCSLQGDAMKPCSCADGLHAEVKNEPLM